MHTDKCRRCHAACCEQGKSRAILFPEEVIFYAPFVEPIGGCEDTAYAYYVRLKDNGDCLLLAQGGRCLVHDMQPLLCKWFPWVPRFHGKSRWFTLSNCCAMLDAGEPPDIREIPEVSEKWIDVFQLLG